MPPTGAIQPNAPGTPSCSPIASAPQRSRGGKAWPCSKASAAAWPGVAATSVLNPASRMGLGRVDIERLRRAAIGSGSDSAPCRHGYARRRRKPVRKQQHVCAAGSKPCGYGNRCIPCHRYRASRLRQCVERHRANHAAALQEHPAAPVIDHDPLRTPTAHNPQRLADSHAHNWHARRERHPIGERQGGSDAGKAPWPNRNRNHREPRGSYPSLGQNRLRHGWKPRDLTARAARPAFCQYPSRPDDPSRATRQRRIQSQNQGVVGKGHQSRQQTSSTASVQ